jgi:hypothetical protein
VKDTVSGAIALALAQKGIGSVESFRDAVQQVLRSRIRVDKGGVPLSPESPALTYRKAVLDTWQSDSPGMQMARRRAVLEARVKDDWQTPDISIVVASGVSDDEVEVQIAAWCEEVASALVPSHLKVFARNRWCTSSPTSGDLFLLSLCHGLLKDVIPVWLRSFGHTASTSCWDDLGEILLDDLEGEAYWAAFNSKQRGDAMRFSQAARTVPCIALWHKTMQPCVRLVDAFLRYASDDWDNNEMQDVACGLPRTFRTLDAANGKILQHFMESMRSALFEASEWTFLPFEHQTGFEQSLAFTMIAKGITGIHRHLSSRFQGYPYRLWLLLDTSRDVAATAASILSDPPCMRCPFTARFLQQYPTAEALQSDDCIHLLLLLGDLLRLDTARIEARHAWLRRVLVVKGSRGMRSFR